MLTRNKHKDQKGKLSILAESILDYCCGIETPIYDVWKLAEINLIENLWDEIVDLYHSEFLKDEALKEHLLHRFYCIVLEDPDNVKDIDYYIKETFYGTKKCGEYKFCELFDNVRCECLYTC